MENKQAIQNRIQTIEDNWEYQLSFLLKEGIIKSDLELKQAEINYWKANYRKLYLKFKEFWDECISNN